MTKSADADIVLHWQPEDSTTYVNILGVESRVSVFMTCLALFETSGVVELNGQRLFGQDTQL
jgi:hypothetical protein